MSDTIQKLQELISSSQLTEEEIQNRYILTCQAHPTSETLIVSYDE